MFHVSRRSSKSAFAFSRAKISLATVLLFAFCAVFVLFSSYPLLKVSKEVTAASQDLRNLIYWSPQQCGTENVHAWLHKLSDTLNATKRVFDPPDHFATRSHWHSRAVFSRSEGGNPIMLNCAVLFGYIRALPMSMRPNEQHLGSIITSVRDAKHMHTSRFFTFSFRPYRPDMLQDRMSIDSRWWFFYFHDLDQCEQLRYYDGIEGCDLDSLDDRVAAIVDRIHCAIVMEDPAEDVKALCEHMGLGADCPKISPVDNTQYADILGKTKHLEPAMERVLAVTNRLNDALKKKRCKFLSTDSVTSAKLLLPTRSCSSRRG